MDIGTALRELGVSGQDLSAAERARLDEDGFLPLPGVLAAGQLQSIRSRLAELHAAEGERAGAEVHQEDGTDRLADLVNKGPVFDVCFTCPRVLAAMAHVLGDFTLSRSTPGRRCLVTASSGCTPTGAWRSAPAATGCATRSG